MEKLFSRAVISLFCLTFLTTCGSDDPSPLDALVGTWSSSSIASSGCTDTSQNGTVTCTPSCITVTINSDGTYTLTDNLEDPPLNETGTAEITATTILLCETGEPDCVDPDPYTLTGSTLVVSFTDEEESPGCTFAATFTRQ